MLDIEQIEHHCSGFSLFYNKLLGQFGNDSPDGLTNSLVAKQISLEEIVLGTNNPHYASTHIIIRGKNVIADAGKTYIEQSLNSYLNSPLMIPGKVYLIDGCFTYHIDILGRTSSVLCDLNLAKTLCGRHNDKLRDDERPNINWTVGAKDGLCDKNDAGHLIALAFNGPYEAINIVPMTKRINRQGGEWRAMEYKWSRLLQTNHSVKVEIIVDYLEETSLPKSFFVRERIDGGPCVTCQILNH